MISRVADQAFWFGRYLERTEAMARVLQTTAGSSLDVGLTQAESWWPLVIVWGERERFAKEHAGSAADAEAVQRFFTWERDHAASIVATTSSARENGRSIREVLSLEAWEATNELYLWLQGRDATALYDEHRHAFYTRVRREVQLALGLLRSTMLHDNALDFIWMGLLLERAGQTARVLDLQHHRRLQQAPPGQRDEPSVHQEVATARWLGVLRACSGFEPFMKRHRGQVNGGAVAGFLLLEPRFPRSIRYCVDQGFDRFCAIRPPHQPGAPGARAHARFAALHRWVHELTPSGVEQGDVHALLTHIVDEVANIAVDIGEEMFGYASRAVEQSQGQSQSA